MGTQPERKENDRQKPPRAAAKKFHVSAAEIDEQDVHQIIVIGVAVIVPNNSLADSLMDEISQFVETATDAQVLEEAREIR